MGVLPRLVVLVLAVMCARPALAAPTVAVVDRREDDVVARRVAAELAALGYAVERVTARPETAPWRDLRGMLAEREAVAAIWVESAPGLVEIWVVDRASGRVANDEIPVPQAPPEDAARLVALQALELLRASLRELAPTPPDQPAPAPTPPPPAAPPRDSTRSHASLPPFSISAAGAVLVSRGGVPPTAQVRLAFRYMPLPRIGIALDALAPTAPARLHPAEGTVAILPAMVAIGPHFELLRPGRIVRLDLGLAVGAGFLRIWGDAPAPTPTRTDVLIGGAGTVRLGFGVRVHPMLVLRIDGAVGAQIPGADVRVAGRDLAQWGLPFGFAALGLELLLPPPRGGIPRT